MSDLLTERGAEVSDCGLYRYVLWRRWDKSKPRLIWIMLNPSVADAEIDDPTIRVCTGRARRMGFGGIRVINLFGWRSTDPKALRTAADPIGEADRYIERYLGLPEEMMIAAWGDGGLLPGRGRHPRWRDAVGLICGDMGKPLHCLGLTNAGQPRHPLRLAYSLEPTLWMDRARWQARAS